MTNPLYTSVVGGSPALEGRFLVTLEATIDQTSKKKIREIPKIVKGNRLMVLLPLSKLCSLKTLLQ